MSASRIGQRLWWLVTPFPALIVGALIMRQHDVPSSRWGLNLIAGVVSAAVCAVFLARSRTAMSKTAASISAGLALGGFGSYLRDGGFDGRPSVDPGRAAERSCRRDLSAGLDRGARRARRVRREAAVGAAADRDFRGGAFVVAARCSSSDRVCGGRVHFADREQATRGGRLGGSLGDCCVSCVDMGAGRSALACSIRRRHCGAGSSERSSLAGRVSGGVSPLAAAVFCWPFRLSSRRRPGARRVSVHLHPRTAFRALSRAVGRVRLVSHRRLLRRPGEPQVMRQQSRDR